MQRHNKKIVLLVRVCRKLPDHRIEFAKVLCVLCILQYDPRVDESPPVGPQYGVVHLDCRVQQLCWYLWFDEIAMG